MGMVYAHHYVVFVDPRQDVQPRLPGLLSARWPLGGGERECLGEERVETAWVGWGCGCV